MCDALNQVLIEKSVTVGWGWGARPEVVVQLLQQSVCFQWAHVITET